MGRDIFLRCSKCDVRLSIFEKESEASHLYLCKECQSLFRLTLHKVVGLNIAKNKLKKLGYINRKTNKKKEHFKDLRFD